MSTIRISKNLALPADTVTQAVAILAKRRMGKSYLARKLAEGLHGAGQQLVIIDPKGDWWGIRSSADGKSDGLPILIIGGEHGDIPLDPGSGETIAKLVVEESVSVLLDLSELRKHEIATFMPAFMEPLYRLKAREQYRTPLMVLTDEADAIAPQKPQPNEARMLGAFNDLVRRGGQRGIGVTFITQRSAVLSKDVLTQAQILIALRVIAPQDLAAIKAWVDVHGTIEEQKTLMASLPSLPVGDAWVWSPGWPTDAGIFQRIHTLPIDTFDSGATPKPGEKSKAPKRLADIDLEAVKRQMAETLERAKADDPKALRARISELEEQLHVSSVALEMAEDTQEPERIEVPVLTEDQLQRLERAAEAMQKHGIEAVEAARDIIGALPQRELLGGGRVGERPPISAHAPAVTKAKPAESASISAPTSAHSRPVTNGAGTADPRVGNTGLRRMLIALAQRPNGLTPSQLALRTGIARTGGTFRTYVGKGKTEGWVDGGPNGFRITQAGLTALGSYQPLPEGRALLDYWLNELGDSGASRMLAAFAKRHPRGLTNNELAEQTGIAVAGGTFRTYLGKLKTLELVTRADDGRHVASAELFT